MAKTNIVVRVPVYNEAGRGKKAIVGNFQKHSAEAFTFNLEGTKLRHEELLGEDHIVVPTVMIVEGVLNGTAGPLLYPREELADDPSAWDHMPVVLYHPEKNGKGMSARDADVLNSQGIGILLNSDYKHPKLKTECWLNTKRLEAIAPEVKASLEKGESVEVSTGLYTDNEILENTEKFNGKEYYAVARNHRPDHLAVLPGQIGACSLKEGAGLLRNAGSGNYTADHKHQLVSDAMRKKHGPGSYTYPEAVSDTHVFYRDPKSGDTVHQPYKINSKGTKAKLQGQPMPVVKKAQYCDPDSGKPIANATWTPTGVLVPNPGADFTDQDSADPATRSVVWSFEQMARRIQQAAPQGKGKIVLEGGRFASVPNVTNHEETKTMKKSAMIAALIANANTVWDEDDREVLEAMSKEKVAGHYAAATENTENGQSTVGEGDDNDSSEEGVNTGVKSAKSKDKPKSKKVAASGPGVTGNKGKSSEDAGDSSDEEAPAKKPTGNSDAEQGQRGSMSFEELVANASPETAEALTEAVQMRSAEKGRLVKAILSNKRCTFDKAALKAMSLNQLQKLAALAGDVEKRRPAANFEGLGLEPSGMVENEDDLGTVVPLGVLGTMDAPKSK